MARHAYIDRIWRFFISLHLTFALLLTIAIGATLGMYFDQTLTYDEFFSTSNRFNGVWAFFEVYDAFHSWWFSLAILFLSANLIACSIERLPRIFFDAVRPRPYLTPRRALGLTLSHSFLAKDMTHAQNAMDQFFRISHQKLALPKAFGFYFLEKYRLARFGVYIVHIALLIVMYSSIFATQNGVDGHVTIEEGAKTRFIEAKGAGGVTYTHDLGFYIGLNDFRLLTFVDNTPMEYESDLFIDGPDKIHKTIRVNDPLTYNGYTFYQASFQPVVSEKMITLGIKGPGGFDTQKKLKLNESFILPNGDELMPERLFGDFAGIGEAVRMRLKVKNQADTYFHLFRKYPTFDEAIRQQPFSLVFLGTDQRFATGLSIGLVPGVSLIFLGFVILVIGVYLCFFVTPVRYFARIVNQEAGLEVFFAAQGYRNPSVVKADFLRRVEQIKPYKVSNHV